MTIEFQQQNKMNEIYSMLMFFRLEAWKVFLLKDADPCCKEKVDSANLLLFIVYGFDWLLVILYD